MEKTTNLLSIRVDDLPLLYSFIHDLGISTTINSKKKAHGNWVGLSLGDLVEFWLCYILSECDHRLSAVEDWAEPRLELFRAMSGFTEISSYDFSDDKLGLLLDYVGDSEFWDEVEALINARSLVIY